MDDPWWVHSPGMCVSGKGMSIMMIMVWWIFYEFLKGSHFRVSEGGGIILRWFLWLLWNSTLGCSYYHAIIEFSPISASHLLWSSDLFSWAIPGSIFFSLFQRDNPSETTEKITLDQKISKKTFTENWTYFVSNHEPIVLGGKLRLKILFSWILLCVGKPKKMLSV